VIEIREANDSDVTQIREIFLATYGSHYAYPQYYDLAQLKKMVYADDTLLLVAQDTDDGRLLGTASVLLDVGAFSDLVGEFGRLAVHPDARRRGVGERLMRGRLERVEERLHVGLIEARVTHPYSQKIALRNGFHPVGFLPMKLMLAGRESVGLLAQYFDGALAMRKNHPRVIPEVYPLSEMALSRCGVPADAVVDEGSAPYAHDDAFQLDELTTEGYATLLRFERGRVRRREIFGPLRLHYGLFKLKVRHSNYLLARDEGQVVGAVGFNVDEVEKAARIFELVSVGDEPIRFLLDHAVRKCREAWGMEYVEVDVSADAPRMQRTLLELGFVPAAYVPAAVFHEVERIDAVRMVRLLVPYAPGELALLPEVERLAASVMRSFERNEVLPRITKGLTRSTLFAGLNDEQVRQLAAACVIESFADGARLITEQGTDQRTYVILAGTVRVTVGEPSREVGRVGPGECLGEMSLLGAGRHSATAIADGHVEAAALSHSELNELIRRRPDIGVVVFSNLASGLGEKLRRSDRELGGRS